MGDRPFGRLGEGARIPFMRGGAYLRLVASYVMGESRADELQKDYRQLYLHDPERPDREDELGAVLYDFYAVIDSFTSDRAVLAADPEFFVSEKTLREQAVITLQKLRILNRSQS